MANSRYKKLYNGTKRTMTGWFNTLYKNMSRRNRAKFCKPLDFTRWDFEQWIIKNHLSHFIELFNAWVKSDYDTDSRPSIDRINNNQCYTFDNMQILTWKQNNAKGIEERTGISRPNRCSRKPVEQFSVNGEYIQTFASLTEAAKSINGCTGSICECCKGIRGKHKGFKWRYADEQKVS